jgi:uncharacterized Fe-S cluster-containing MiaB family protein
MATVIKILTKRVQKWVQQCLSVRVSGTYSYHCAKHNERTHGNMTGQVFCFVASDQVCRLWSTHPRLLNVIFGTGGCGWPNTMATCSWCHVGHTKQSNDRPGENWRVLNRCGGAVENCAVRTWPSAGQHYESSSLQPSGHYMYRQV